MTLVDLLARPRLLGLVCGGAAVLLGLAYMFAAAAPATYLIVNLAALVLGAALWAALGGAGGTRFAGAIVLACAVPLLLTAAFGLSVEGASRWVGLAGLTVQVSLVLLPPMILLYARRPDALGTAGMMLAALALAMQPDRAMAGVLLAGLLGPALAHRSAAAAAVAAAAFGRTLLIPDDLPAVPYVDGILVTAFGVHPLAGAAVVLGAIILALPAFGALRRHAGERSTLLAFGGCWAAVVAAAALGNYPTPLVGYGGAAILGYLLSAALLPSGAREGGRASVATRAAGAWQDDLPPSERRIALPS